MPADDDGGFGDCYLGGQASVVASPVASYRLAGVVGDCGDDFAGLFGFVYVPHRLPLVGFHRAGSLGGGGWAAVGLPGGWPEAVRGCCGGFKSPPVGSCGFATACPCRLAVVFPADGRRAGGFKTLRLVASCPSGLGGGDVAGSGGWWRRVQIFGAPPRSASWVLPLPVAGVRVQTGGKRRVAAQSLPAVVVRLGGGWAGGSSTAGMAARRCFYRSVLRWGGGGGLASAAASNHPNKNHLRQ